MMFVMLAGNVSATVIERVYTDGDNGGIVTFSDSMVGSSYYLTLEIDNTTTASNVGPGTYENSSVISGIVFDIVTDITALTVVSFNNSDGAIAGWTVELNVNNNITPGNAVVDLSFTSDLGINGGLYNDADQGSNLDNAFPDIATLVLEITAPNPWALSEISNDILRMQRVGYNGDGSLKIPGSSSGGSTGSSGGSTGSSGEIPEPSILLLFGSGLIWLGWKRRKA